MVLLSKFTDIIKSFQSIVIFGNKSLAKLVKITGFAIGCFYVFSNEAFCVAEGPIIRQGAQLAFKNHCTFFVLLCRRSLRGDSGCPAGCQEPHKESLQQPCESFTLGHFTGITEATKAHAAAQGDTLITLAQPLNPDYKKAQGAMFYDKKISQPTSNIVGAQLSPENESIILEAYKRAEEKIQVPRIIIPVNTPKDEGF